ncbi:MAG: hypothetical protein CMG66_06105 [Candidatus Marinimicrobia bacterium]|nr:hypothetical protein [Candidatus Neomarinimicrobiota bacterium]|tara:strand:- start:9657 stop:10883 length:1227 start_codon:yes stop_codon:yes gene_type:complete
MLELNLGIIGLFFSVLFSASEIALISAKKLQIDVWVKQKYKLGQLTKFIIENKSKFLTVSLIGTNLSNILASSFFTIYLMQIISNNTLNFPEGLIFIPIAITILLFGEILPKTIIREYSNIALLILSPIMYISYIIFYPFVILFSQINFNNKKHYLSKKEILAEKREEFEKIFEHIDKEIEIEKDQKEIISNIFDYREQLVNKVMTPLDSISAIPINSHLDDLAHKFIDSGHSKIPVYDKNLDNIKGIIYLYDLYSKPKNLEDILKEVLFVPYTELISNLMKTFKEKNQSIAIVLDAKGNTSGIITIEDIFEELFGDFEDEFDYQKLHSWINKDGSIITNANISIKEFNKKYSNLIPIGDYETIGGYIIEKLGRIPNKNEHIFLQIGQILIKKASSRRIEQVQIFINQ